MNSVKQATFISKAREYIESLRYADRSLFANAWMETLLGWRTAPTEFEYKISITMTSRAQYREGEIIRKRIYAIADSI